MTVTVKINSDSPTGRKLLRELAKHPKVVKIESELPEGLAGKKFYKHEEVFNECYDILSQQYGVDVKNLI